MRAALRIVKSLYFQVLVAVALGVTLGFVKPSWGEAARPLGDAFIRLVKMMIAPIVLVTVTTGIAGLGDLKKVGRVGVKALFYFEAVTSVALAVGLGVVHLVRPGDGLHIDVRTVDTSGLAAYTGTAAKGHGLADVLRELIPDTMVGAVAKGEILGVLLVSMLLGMAISGMGDKGKPLLDWLALVQKALFGAVKLVMYLAPLGAFGAMAFTVGKYGVSSLVGLGKLVACFYLTSFLFVALALGAILKVVGLSIVKLVRYLGEELLVVLSTSSSESALPRLMDKLEHLGCSKAVVGLVVPTGYSFNLDGTAIYLTMAAMFVAQATDTHLSFGAELGILGVLLLTSKGAAAVTGGGFVTLAATLATTGDIPVAGLAILLGVDRFLSEARALTNLVGNAVATIVVARWEGELDVDRARDVLEHRSG